MISKLLFLAKRRLLWNRIAWYFNPVFYWRLLRLLFRRNSGRRFLGIWHYGNSPWSIGDPLTFIATISALAVENGCKEIDIAVIYDKKNPIGKRTTYHGDPIDSTNCKDYIFDHLSLFSTSPFPGTVYQFSTDEEFRYFLKKNLHRYDLYPGLGAYLCGQYDYHDFAACDIRILESHYRKHGNIPELSIGDREINWAYWFYRQYCPGKIPIALTLRNIPGDTIRNADYSVWLPFLDECYRKYPEIIFSFVGVREEAIPEFYQLPNMMNLIVTKDYGTTLREDMALIRTSLFHMGTMSGINAISIFSEHPYLLFQMPNFDRYGHKPGENWAFANYYQKTFTTEQEMSPLFLLHQFEEMYAKLDVRVWQLRTRTHAMPKSGIPTVDMIRENEK